MNILVFSWRDPKHPMAGGAEQVMHEHMKGWIAAGHNVTLFTSNFGNSKKEEMLDGISIIRRGSQLLGVHFLGFMWYLFGKHQKYDLIIDQFHGIPFFTSLYARTRKIAVLQEVAREVWLLNHLPKPLNKIIGYLGYYTEPIIFKFYKNIPFITGSKSAKDDLVKMGIPASNVWIVPHGVIVPVKECTFDKENTKTVIFLGALARDKGIEDAIEAFFLLHQKGNFQFWIVGRGEAQYVRYLNSLVNKLGFSKKVVFWGFVSQEKKFELLARSHVMINPSSKEGWGLVNIEANFVGTPVVAYNSAGLIDSIKDGKNGLICQQNSPKGLAEKINKLLNNPKLYSKLQKGALSWSRQFSWTESKTKSLSLLDRFTND